MNKKLMAVAVAGALGALAAPEAALAQASTVQIGGSITTFYYKHSPNNPSTGQSTDILETSEPELFVRGEENLGGGLTAWFQCTSSLDGMVTGAASAAGMCGRNSGIGLKGAWGNIFQGNWDAPQKLVFNRARGWFGGTNSLTGGGAVLLNGGSASGAQNPVQTVIFSPAAAAANTASTVITNNPGSFFRRQAASWNYWSPSWNGFVVQAAISAANQQTGNPAASPLSQRMWSLAGHYDNGPLYLGVGYEKHDDYNPGNLIAVGATAASSYTGGDDTNWTFVAGYTFAGQFKLTGIYSRSDYDVNSAGGGIKVRGWGTYADWAIQGPHSLKAAYIRVGDTSGTSSTNVGSYKGPAGVGCGPTSAVSCATGTGAKVWQLAYAYDFSKRTQAFLAYYKMKNDTNASFSIGKVAATAGNSQSSFGLGFKHRF